MSAGVGNLQAQVESVLGALVKAASVELFRLFESRYRASAVDVGRTDGVRGSESPDTLFHQLTGDTKRSIGVQVEDDVSLLVQLTGPPPPDAGCLREPDELKVELCVHEGPEFAPLNSQKIAAPLGKMDCDVLEEKPAMNAVVVHDPETWGCGFPYMSEAEQKSLVIKADPSTTSSGEADLVCALMLKPEPSAPIHDSLEKPVHAEPQQEACVSTARGTAYSPSPSDGAVTPVQAGVWERITTPEEGKSLLQMKLKLNSQDQKLLLPCSVQLVNLLTIPESERNNEGATAKAPSSNCSSGRPQPKDLRWHQGPHTGHRLCCFTRCGGGIWRLQKIVTHSREGYVCSICSKAFKRRKILRRHERFHTGERPYACSVCAKTFALRKSLRRHLRFHTGERPYNCTQCGKSFRLRDNLKAHLRFHSGEKPFTCGMCGKMFRILRNLEKHKRSHCEVFVPSFRTIAGFQV